MSKLRVMIVDDNIHFQNAFKFILLNEHEDKVGEIYLAKNGKECLEILEKKTIDIVFMDLDMPLMDGVETTKKAVDQYRNLKIIAVSFHSEFNDVRRMLEAGARNYIIKEEITKEVLERYLVKN